MLNKSLVLLSTRLGRRLSTQRGVTATEYGLIIAVVAIVMLVAAKLLGSNINTLFSSVAGDV
ncbi:MAG: Flp family type IVb pilin [Nevskia sp.]|nr:Flp family type IVb pilin [Nevskia sp.]